jgi:signal transduction histidine kinase
MKSKIGLKKGANQINISQKLDERLPSTAADPQKLQQVFLNLLLNGIEAMPNGGTLSATSSSTAEHIQIEISDTGEGLDPETIEKIFEPFFTQKRKGTGLGLAVTKSLVEQHTGTIRAENADGGGARFIVRLPVRELQEEGRAA